MSTDPNPLLLPAPTDLQHYDKSSGFTKTGRSKAELRAERLARLTPWKPGQSGNPSGKPRQTFQDQLVKKLVRKRYKEASAICDAMIEKAKSGDVPAFVAIADRVDGKPVQRTEGQQAITITVERIGD